MALERLTQITEVGIQSGITLRNVNVEGAYVSGVVTATSLNITSAGANFTGVVTATSFDGNVTGNINPNTLNVTGVSTFNANIFLGDGDAAYFGDGQDLLIFHNSTDSIIRDNGTGDLFIEGGNVIRMTNPTGIETYATFNQDAAVELYYDGTKKFETTSGGASVTGDLVVSGIITSGTSTITIDGPNNSITVGESFIKSNAVGLGATDTTGRNAGVGTATGSLIYNSDSGNIEYYNGNVWVALKRNFDATGGTITFANGKKIHTFTSSGTFTVNIGSIEVDYLVVAGGGGGGVDWFNARSAGGGGAGGYRTGSGLPVSNSPGVYSITVGAGGNGGLVSPGPAVQGSNGGNSIFSTITSTGGGGGGGHDNGGNVAGNPGGSGGGGTHDPGNGPAGSGNTPSTSPPQGSPGGSSGQTVGGAGSASTISGTSVTYAGGGGAAQSPNPYAGGGGGGASQAGQPGFPSAGGAGGGGAGSSSSGTTPAAGTPGTQNLGGGGGASRWTTGGNGGSGIVIIAYPS